MDKEKYYIFIKSKIYQVDISSLYAPIKSEPSFVKETALQMKSQIDSHIFIVGDFNTLFSPIDMSFIQKQNREILELSDVINQRVITSV